MRAASPLLPALLALLCGCDWGHHVQFQVRPRPDDLEVADALRHVAAAERFVPPEPPADDLSYARWRDRYSPCFLGVFVDADDHGAGRPVWFGGWARHDLAAVELDEFNRGWPWKPSPRFRATERALTIELRRRFGPDVRLVRKPGQKVEPR